MSVARGPQVGGDGSSEQRGGAQRRATDQQLEGAPAIDPPRRRIAERIPLPCRLVRFVRLVRLVGLVRPIVASRRQSFLLGRQWQRC